MLHLTKHNGNFLSLESSSENVEHVENGAVGPSGRAEGDYWDWTRLKATSKRQSGGGLNLSAYHCYFLCLNQTKMPFHVIHGSERLCGGEAGHRRRRLPRASGWDAEGHWRPGMGWFDHVTNTSDGVHRQPKCRPHKEDSESRFVTISVITVEWAARFHPGNQSLCSKVSSKCLCDLMWLHFGVLDMKRFECR